ncbi:peptidoglycan-binding protein [Bacillus sp. WMMC1349]|nr:peptidoglycan-binding protein [Bacillus sp. WMMC1349]
MAGYYGPKTKDAIRRFQLMHGLVAKGIYGPKTKAKLEAYRLFYRGLTFLTS